MTRVGSQRHTTTKSTLNGQELAYFWQLRHQLTLWDLAVLCQWHHQKAVVQGLSVNRAILQHCFLWFGNSGAGCRYHHFATNFKAF
jgi:hypothetical protein